MNREIARITKRMRLGRPIDSPPVTLTSTVVGGTRIQFATNNEVDPVQRKHRKGTFYELTELSALAALFPKGGTFVDIGAHVGNHSLFAAFFMDAATIIPIEPNPAAYRLLIQNMLINGVSDRFDISRLGCAVGAENAQGASMKPNRRKPAATRLRAKGGKISVARAETLLTDVTPDLIKIDTPGMEMEVLDGLAEVFARSKPVILIEVAAAHDADFQKWVKKTGYTVEGTTKRNKNDLNYMLRAKAPVKTATKKAPAPKTASAKSKPAAKKTTTARKTAVKSTTSKAKATAKRATAKTASRKTTLTAAE